MVLAVMKWTMLCGILPFWILKDIKISILFQKVQRFWWISGICLSVELYQKGSAPAACTADFFFGNLSLAGSFPFLLLPPAPTRPGAFGWVSSIMRPGQGGGREGPPGGPDWRYRIWGLLAPSPGTGLLHSTVSHNSTAHYTAQHSTTKRYTKM